MTIEFEPVQFEPTYRKVATTMLERITDRTLSAGDRLPAESELARQFGVNRSTVREALRELESAGMVRRQRGSKLMMVTRPQRESMAEGVSRALALHDVTIRQLWEGLTILEPPIAAAAALARSSANLARLAALVVQPAPSSALAAAQQASEFFRQLGEATHNPVLMLAHEPLLQLLCPSLRTIVDEVAVARARIITAQRHILAALTARDEVEARRWADKHIRDFRRGFDLAGIDLSNRVE